LPFYFGLCAAAFVLCATAFSLHVAAFFSLCCSICPLFCGSCSLCCGICPFCCGVCSLGCSLCSLCCTISPCAAEFAALLLQHGAVELQCCVSSHNVAHRVAMLHIKLQHCALTAMFHVKLQHCTSSCNVALSCSIVHCATALHIVPWHLCIILEWCASMQTMCIAPEWCASFQGNALCSRALHIVLGWCTLFWGDVHCPGIMCIVWQHYRALRIKKGVGLGCYASKKGSCTSKKGHHASCMVLAFMLCQGISRW